MEVLSIIGLIVFVMGGFGLLIAAFKTNILWGVGVIVFAPAALVFTVLHWSEARNPFLLQLFGLLMMFFGSNGLQSL